MTTKLSVDKLCMTAHGIPKRHFLIIGNDANAKFGCDLPSNQIIGHFTTGSLYDNSAMLRHFCIEYVLLTTAEAQIDLGLT
jgi:hypothetical protein